MLIAVTSSDGITINQHFGKAERFLIYEVGQNAPKLVRVFDSSPYCNWSATVQDMTPEQLQETLQQMRECADAPPDHRMMPDKLSAIAAGLGDCRVIVTAMIGEAPRDEMERQGFDLVVLSGPIAEVLQEVAKLY